MTQTLLHGSAEVVLPTLAADSFDSLVTDPPAGIGFMGKEWDKDKGGRDGWIEWMAGVMREAFRVLKPGAHGLVWALPRTSHWTATALENAGFEIRDVHLHLFGTGFPKSLDVSKEIDRVLGVERVVTGTRPGTGSTTFAGEADGKGLGPTVAITAPATPEAERWQGWGTALKPAAEHWILVRKPLAGTVAANVLEHGTGALNIDACRIGTADTRSKSSPTALGVMNDDGWQARPVIAGSASGRWPAHVSLDEEAAAMLDEQSGISKSSAALGVRRHGRSGGILGEVGPLRDGRPEGHNDSGGASRFFYVAKPSKRERGAGNNHPTVKSLALMTWLIRLITPPGGTVLDPFAGSGTTLLAARAGGWNAVGIEQHEPYAEIARGRLAESLL